MTAHQMKTQAVKQCFSCAAPLPATDNFCRCCGTSQQSGAVSTPAKHWTERKTRLVSHVKGVGESTQTLSGLLVSSLTQIVAVKTMPLRYGRLGSRVIAGVVAIPIWLLIILLSPLDAYTAAKAASSQLYEERTQC